MKKKMTSHIIAIMALAVFAILGIASAATIPYTEPPLVDMSGIKRVGIIADNYPNNIIAGITRPLNAAGITIANEEIPEWRRWNDLTARQRRATEITAVNLARAYSENVPRADSNYGNGKILRVTGVVDSIDVARGRYYVRLTGSGNDAVFIFFYASETNRVRTLNKGQTVTFIGECYGRNVPDDEDIAEILRILGAGNRVNIVNGYFPVSNYQGSLDAIITYNTTHTTLEPTPIAGVILTTDPPAIQVSYQVWNTRTNSIIGQGKRVEKTYGGERE